MVGVLVAQRLVLLRRDADNLAPDGLRRPHAEESNGSMVFSAMTPRLSWPTRRAVRARDCWMRKCEETRKGA